MIHSQQQARIKPNMATAEYSNDQLNYFKLCHIITDEVAGSLRLFFKKEWNRLYKRTFGEWKDLPKNGWDFCNGESPNNHERHAEELAIMVNGNTAEWDCTKLFYAIRYSDCIGWFLKPDYVKALEKLRKARNKSYGHISLGQINDAKFKYIIKQIEDALQALGLSRNRIQMVCNQKSFPTEELNNVLKKVEVLEAQLHKEISSFCVLPPKPSHEVADRDREVAEIAKQLKELKKANENRLSYLYISGNPGSGKSQLAGLVAKRFFDEGTQIPFTTSFVMTINGKSPSSLLESYISLARKLKCPEYSVTNTLNSPDLNSGEKIAHLKTLISEKIELYTTWLLVVDNVESLFKIYAYLPASGNEQWARGQLLITTQDTASVPPMSPFVNHVSVSKGMEPHDAVCLLKKVSGISGRETEEVARKLDYQPLTLAEAAAYVREVREIKGEANFGWRDYFEKLKEGRIVATDTIVVDPVYPKSMGEVTRLAVKEAIESTNVIIRYVFTLLFFCTPQPLSLEIVTNYIRNANVEMDDEDAISMKIQRCCLLLFHQEKDAFFIRIHQVVHDAIRAVLKDYLKADKLGAMKAALVSFYQFVKDNRRDHLSYLHTFAKHAQCIPHLESLSIQIKETFSVEKTRHAVEIMLKSQRDTYYLETLGRVCQEQFEFQTAKEYFNIVLNIRLKYLKPDDLDVGRAYNNMGIVQRDPEKLEEAKRCYNRALPILIEKLGPEDVDVGIIYKNLGIVHKDLSDPSQAKKYFEFALPILQKELGPEYYLVGKTHLQLGNVLRDLYELNQAKESYDRALTILLKEGGPEHVDVGITYRNLGIVHKQMCASKQAKEYFELALPILQKELGPEYYLVASTHLRLGNVLRHLGELNQAKDNCDRALTIFLKEFGPEDVDVGLTYYNLGSVHKDLSDLDQAKKYFELALPILQKELGPEYYYVGATHMKLGNVLRDLYKLDQAKENYDRALTIFVKEFGPEYGYVGETYYNLGIVHKDLSDLDQAKKYFELALPILQKELGPEYYLVGKTHMKLGNVLRDLGELNQAKESHHLALTILLKEGGPEHVDVGITYRNLGIVHKHLQDLDEAKKYFELALPILQKELGPEYYLVGSTHLRLGNVLRHLGELNQAKDNCDRAQTIFLKEFGPEDVDVGLTYYNLGSVHKDLSDLDQAKKYFELALPILQKELGPEYYYVGATHMKLGNVLRDLGELNQAKESHRLALTILLKEGGPEHVNVGITYRNLGIVHKHLQDLDEAKKYFELALPILQKEQGPECLVVGETHVKLGNVLKDLGELNQAKESYDRALSILLKKFRSGHRLVKMTKDSLVKIKQLQENCPRSSGGFGKRPTGSGHPGLVPAKRSKKM